MPEKYKVLVVDDSKQVLFVNSTMLKKMGFEVHTAENARDGIALAFSKMPDIILMDVMMPNVDGFKACQVLKSRDETKSIPVIMVTAKNSRKDILQAKEVGADNYIIKPVSAQVIYEKVCAELAKRGKIAQPSQGLMPPPAASADVASVSAAPAAPLTPVAPSAPARSSDEEGGDDAPDTDEIQLKIKKVLRKTKELLALPFAVNRALKVSGDTSSGAGDLAKIISSDVAITAMVLKKANSSYYGTQKRIVDVKEAIIRIGFTQTKSIVVGLSIIQLFNTQQKAHHFNRLAFWEHCLGVGILSKHLAVRCGYKDPQEAFMAGLLHDIGKILLDENMPEDFDKALASSAAAVRPLYEVEKELYGFTHMDMGEMILEKWQMPEHMTQIARLHHGLKVQDVKGEEFEALLKVVHYGNLFAKVYGFGEAGDNLLRDMPAEDAQYFKFEQGVPPDFEKTARLELEDFKSFLGVDSRPMDESSRKALHLLDENRKIVNVHSSSLQAGGYDIQTHATLNEMSQADPAATLFVVDMGEDFRDPAGWEMLKAAASMRTIIVLTPPALMERFKALQLPRELVLIHKPVWSSALLREVSKNIGAVQTGS